MKKDRILAAAILLCVLMAPAWGISVSFSSGNGGESVSSSTRYSLDDSTKLSEQAVLGEGGISQTRELAGAGQNSINQAVSGKGYSANNIIAGTGSFRVTTASVASSAEAGLSQSLTGSGDMRAAVKATTGYSTASQDAEVASGELSTIQSLAATGSVQSSQSTALRGEAGSIASISSSPENEMSVAGGFSGEGDLKADLNAAASGQAFAGGEASFLGLPVLGSDEMQYMASNDIGMDVEALYEPPQGGLGTFGLSTANFRKDSVGSDRSNLLTRPALTSDGGSSNAYALLNRRWNQKDPQIKWYLKDDAILRNEGLDPTSVAGAIAGASNTWDDASNQNLFADTSLVTVSKYIAGDTRDYKNTHSFKVLATGGILGYSRSWYTYAYTNGYRSTLESDIIYNAQCAWSTTGERGKIDIQTVALHEMGHSLGLGDLYNKPQFAGDTRQIMHYYTGVKRTLGNGDKTGAWLLYH